MLRWGIFPLLSLSSFFSYSIFAYPNSVPDVYCNSKSCLSNIFTFNQTVLSLLSQKGNGHAVFPFHFLSINSLLIIFFFILFSHKDVHVLPPEERLSVLTDHSENSHALRKDQLTVYWPKTNVYSSFYAFGLK